MKKAILLVLTLAAGACSVNEGTFTANWTVTLDGAAASCASVGGTTVTIVATRASGGRSYEADFPCGASSGEFDVPPGSYNIQAEITDSRGTLIHPAISADRAFTLADGDVVPLGTFNFSFVTPVFRASFRVHMGSSEVTGGNCNSTNSPNPGAGVALEEIQLLSGGQCLPAIISGTDVSGANACETLVCQPNTTIHVLEGLTPGSFQLKINGYKGATGATPAWCYESLAMPFTITNGDVNLGEIFVPFTDAHDSVRCNATKPQGE